eukprot:6174393-Pleurochrysis_carterae.AAC.1
MYSVHGDPSCAPHLHLDLLCCGAKHPDLEFSASIPRSRVAFGASYYGYSPTPLPLGLSRVPISNHSGAKQLWAYMMLLVLSPHLQNNCVIVRQYLSASRLIERDPLRY